MTPPFVSYAQNGEDVVLHRALGHVGEGRYIEVGANDPVVDSISQSFYQRGWRGILVEPVPRLAESLRAQRVGDVVVQAAVSAEPSGSITLHEIAGTGLSSTVDEVGEAHRGTGWAVEDIEVPAVRLDSVVEEAGWSDGPIHFVMIDVEGAERDVLDTFDLRRWRPWVLVIEATEPKSTTPSHDQWEQIVLDAGYRFCLFDGLSRFYVSDEKYDELHTALGYPACAHDEYVTQRTVELQQSTDEAHQATQQALTHAHDLQQQLDTSRQDLAAARGEFEARISALEGEIVDARAEESQALASALRWRHRAVEAWANASVGSRAEHEELVFLREHAHSLFTELNATHKTLSWRVTAPLRKVRRFSPGRPGS